MKRQILFVGVFTEVFMVLFCAAVDGGKGRALEIPAHVTVERDVVYDT